MEVQNTADKGSLLILLRTARSPVQGKGLLWQAKVMLHRITRGTRLLNRSTASRAVLLADVVAIMSSHIKQSHDMCWLIGPHLGSEHDDGKLQRAVLQHAPQSPADLRE